jgi:hypothetical protein
MYNFDHALFLEASEYARRFVDAVFHGHGFDYMFQGIYMHVKYITLFRKKTFLKSLRPMDGDFISDYLGNTTYRLKNTDLLRYIKVGQRDRMMEYLRASVAEIMKEGSDVCRTPYDTWEYMLIHSLSRHYPNTNLSSMGAFLEQRTICFDNDIFDFYLSLPSQMRIGAPLARKVLELLAPEMAKVSTANTRMPAHFSPLQQTSWQILRWGARQIVKSDRLRPPAADDRTWPNRNEFLRRTPAMADMAKELCDSPALSCLGFLDMDRIRDDIAAWIDSGRGGGDFIFTLITLDRFLKQAV